MVYLKKLFLFSVVFILISSSEAFSQVKVETTSDTTKTDFSYNILEKTFSKGDFIPIKNKAELIKELDKVDFINGTVYFAGAGFPNVISRSIGPNGFGFLSSSLDLCLAGTQITFDNCIIKSKDGTIVKNFKKSILFY
ncbi:MAG: hypothetical protein ABIP69_06080 [Ferruginibacter sp.]